MRIAYNPKTAEALVSPPDNEDITFDLSGLAIYAKGVKFEGKVYSVFKKHTLNTTGGYDGLVPAPSYTETITRYLREDGTWEVPTNTTYTFASGTTGDFTVTPSGGTAQTVSIGKPATAGDADTVDSWHKSYFPIGWNGSRHYLILFGLGGLDLNWKKIAETTSNLTTAPTSNNWSASSIKGKIYRGSDNYSSGLIIEYPFMVTFHYVSGTSLMNTATLYLPKFAKNYDNIRVVRVSTNKFELQVRMTQDWQNDWIEFQGKGTSLTCYESLQTANTTGTIVCTAATATTLTLDTANHAYTADGAKYVFDYNATTTPIYIGFASTGLTSTTASHLAAYGTTSSGARCIKDISAVEAKKFIGLGNVQNTAFYKRVVTVNGSGWDMAGTNSNAAFTIYAPTTAGTSGLVLTSTAGTPGWTNLSSLSVGNADTVDNKHASDFIQTSGQMISGKGGKLAGYHQENGWHRIATIDRSSSYGHGSHILYLTGTYNYAQNTNAIIHINTMDTTGKITQVSGYVGFANKIRLVNVSSNKFYVDVHINYTDNTSVSYDTPGTIYYYFLGNGSVTVNESAEKITDTVTAASEVTLVNTEGNVLTSGNYTNWINTTNFPGLNKVGTVTQVIAGTGISVSATTANQSTYTVTNAGVRATTINGNYLRVNTNGTNADLTIPYATRASIAGDGTMNMIPQYNNEINFGGTNASTTLYFGYRATDSKPIPTQFIFGGSDGSASIKASGFIKKGSSDSYVLLGGGGHKALADFLLESEFEEKELTSNIKSISKSLKVTAAWMDTGIKYTDLPANGSYIVQVSAHNSKDDIWYCYWTGVMSWYKDVTNDSDADEILLHRAGHAYGHTIYLRTIMTANSDGRHLRLQIAADTDLSTAVTYTFKFKRII